MKVELLDGYFMTVSPDGFELRQPRPSKSNPNGSIVLAYCSSFDRVINRMIHHHLGGRKESVDLSRFLDEWRALQSQLEEKFPSTMKT